MGEEDKDLQSMVDSVEQDANNCDIVDITNLTWKRHGGYKVFYLVKRFFSNPNRQTEKYLPLLDTVSTLIQNSSAGDPDSISATKEFLKLHRLVENTKARRRLERWAIKLTCTYLAVVALIIICHAFGVSIEVSGRTYVFKLSDAIIVTLLSTTTINVIGLAIILMKGMFPPIYDEENGTDSKSSV